MGAAISATYAQRAARELLGVNNPAPTPGNLVAAPVSAVLPEFAVLAVMGVIFVPLGL